MKRTTVFLTDDLERLLHETARRTGRPQAEIVRVALAQYLESQVGAWPRSVGAGREPDRSVTSVNVKDWVRERMGRDTEEPS